jgi:uncharacterized protein YfaS (alpha-2-macroglobulin family)
VVKQFGGLEVTTSSTNLQALTDAMLYLVTYPFECSEQRASRILAIAALRDVLSAFAVAGMPSPAEMEARVAADLERLENMQNSDGGFPIWERGRETWPYLTVHVVNALARAKAKGYQVDADMLDAALAYLARHRESLPALLRRGGPALDLQPTRCTCASWSATSTCPRRSGCWPAPAASSKLSMEADGWLLGTLAGQADAGERARALLAHLQQPGQRDRGRRQLHDQLPRRRPPAAGTPTAASTASSSSRSSRRPRSSDLIPKLVTGLLAHKKAGRWLNTQENSLALLALDRYFADLREGDARTSWPGSGSATATLASTPSAAATTERFQLDVPMAWVADQLGRGKTPGRGRPRPAEGRRVGCTTGSA